MYNKLVSALKQSGIPFTEIAWGNAPQSGPYGVIALDSQAATVWADGRMQEQALEGTIDLFVRDKGMTEMLAVQAILAQQGVSWNLNSIQFEPARQIVHFEWVFQIEVI